MLKFNWLASLFDKRGGIMLTATGFALDISCAVMTGKACIRANRIIEAKMEEYGRSLTPQEKVEFTWKLFLLPIGLGTAGAACHIGTNVWYTSQNKKKEAALMTIAAGTETAYTRLKEEIPEVVGKNKASKIEEKVAQKAAQNSIPKNEEGIENIKKSEEFGQRNVLVYDSFQGRWFYTNTEEITHVQNVIQGLQNGNPDDPVTLNEVNYEFGLKDSKIGATHVWIKDYDDLMNITWCGGDGTFLKEDGSEEPYLVMMYDPEPKLWFTE